MDAQTRANQLARNAQIEAQEEISIQELGLENFSYANCQVSTGYRNKRFAHFTEKLTEEQNQALMNYAQHHHRE